MDIKWSLVTENHNNGKVCLFPVRLCYKDLRKDGMLVRREVGGRKQEDNTRSDVVRLFPLCFPHFISFYKSLFDDFCGKKSGKTHKQAKFCGKTSRKRRTDPIFVAMAIASQHSISSVDLGLQRFARLFLFHQQELFLFLPGKSFKIV